MEIYLVRHGIAEDPVEASLSGRGDPLRRLTTEGLERTGKVAAAFRERVEKVDLILHSPYVRARETAALFAKAFQEAEIREEGSFRPEDDPEVAAAILEEYTNHRRLMVVSHEPFLGSFTSYLLTGGYSASITFKKAAIAGLDWGGPGASRLLFLIPPKVLLG